jgi:hypothetical protein
MQIITFAYIQITEQSRNLSIGSTVTYSPLPPPPSWVPPPISCSPPPPTLHSRSKLFVLLNFPKDLAKSSSGPRYLEQGAAGAGRGPPGPHPGCGTAGPFQVPPGLLLGAANHSGSACPALAQKYVEVHSIQGTLNDHGSLNFSP